MRPQCTGHCIESVTGSILRCCNDLRSAVAKQRGEPSAQVLLEQGSLKDNPVLLPVRPHVSTLRDAHAHLRRMSAPSLPCSFK